MRDDEKNVVQFPDTTALEAEAAEWVVRLDGDEATAADRAAFLEWQSRSAYHREIAARLSGLWRELDFLQEHADPVCAVRGGVPEPGKSIRRGLRPKSWTRPWAVAAAASILLAVAAIPVLLGLRTVPVTSLAYETAVGQHKTVSLPDGSKANLNTNSRIEVVFSGEQRDVRLVRGEAYFEVAHDAQRPFAVHARSGLVRDVGTVFDVRLLPKTIDVTVVHGSVELARLSGDKESGGKKEEHLAFITAGQQAQFGRKVVSLALVSDAAIDRMLAWRRGVLIYNGQPLAQVVGDFNRYTNIRIEIADPSLNAISVGGYFEIGKTDALFEALENNFGVRVERLDANHVRLFANRERIRKTGG